MIIIHRLMDTIWSLVVGRKLFSFDQSNRPCGMEEYHITLEMLGYLPFRRICILGRVIALGSMCRVGGKARRSTRLGHPGLVKSESSTTETWFYSFVCDVFVCIFGMGRLWFRRWHTSVPAGDPCGRETARPEHSSICDEAAERERWSRLWAEVADECSAMGFGKSKNNVSIYIANS